MSETASTLKQSGVLNRLLRMSPGQRRNNINGWVFILPWLLGFLIFTLYPALSSLYYSFTDYNIIQTPHWTGLSNYVNLIAHDPLFWVAVGNTLFWVGLFVPLNVFLSVVIALLLNVQVRGIGIYRALVFLPSIVPDVVIGILWFWMLNPQFGFANQLLKTLGLPTIGWLSDPMWSKPSLVLVGLWGLGGSMVIYLAALQDVPEQLYEAASIDGANVWQRTRFITLPMITPTIFFNLVLGIISAFQSFTSVFIISRGTGGPLNSTLFYGLLLYRNGFTFLKMGYASAMAWILFVGIVILTFIVFKSSGRWVFYGGESN